MLIKSAVRFINLQWQHPALDANPNAIVLITPSYVEGAGADYVYTILDPRANYYQTGPFCGATNTNNCPAISTGCSMRSTREEKP